MDCTLGGAVIRSDPGALCGRAGRVMGSMSTRSITTHEARLRADGFGTDVSSRATPNFAGLPKVACREGSDTGDLILATLRVHPCSSTIPLAASSTKGRSSRHADESTEGESRRTDRAFDRRELARGSRKRRLTAAHLIANLLIRPPETTHAVDRLYARASARRSHVGEGRRQDVHPDYIPGPAHCGERRVLRLDALLRTLPQALRRWSGRDADLSLREDRRVKKAFQTGYRGRVYSAVADEVIRSTKEETFANRRASAAKLRWAVRAPEPDQPIEG